MENTKLFVQESEKRTLLDSEQGAKGYMLFLKDVVDGTTNYYSLCNIETAAQGVNLFSPYTKSDEFVRDGLLTPFDGSVKAVPYHHQANEEQTAENFAFAQQMMEGSEDYFDIFCLTYDHTLGFFTPKREGGLTLQETIPHEVISEESLTDKIAKELAHKRTGVVMQLKQRAPQIEI